MAPNIIWLGAALVSAAVAIAAPDGAQITAAPTLIPRQTQTTGNDLVSEELGNPTDYALTDLGLNNPVLTWDGKVYHYIEGHTNYLSLETMTSTISNKPATATSEIKVAIETAVADGAIGLTFAEDVGDALRKAADAANQACGLKKRSLSKRADPISCLIDAAVKASGADGPLEAAATDAFWESIATNVAANAPAYLESAIAVLKSQAQKKKTLIILSAFLGAKLYTGPIAALKLPKVGVGEPDAPDNDKCDPSKPANEDSPLCIDQDCQGNQDTEKCTTGSEKDCACLLLGNDAPTQPRDGAQSWWDEQQRIIGSVDANHALLGTAAPSCTVNSDGNAFDGKPVATPASWCVCDSAGTKRIYPTVDTSSSPCAYTASPTATISPKVTQVTGGSVTSCRTETITGAGVGAGPYCTCNDNSMYPIATWTNAGSAVTGCAATKTTQAAAASTPTCNVNKQFSIKQDSLVSAGDKFCSDNSGTNLATIPSNPYSNGQIGYNKDGASSGGQLLMFAYLDKGCTNQIKLNQDDCKMAFQSIFDRCDKGADTRQGGAASINCQWYNITAVDKCMGSSDSFSNPGSCKVGNLPSYYSGWPLGTIPS